MYVCVFALVVISYKKLFQLKYYCSNVSVCCVVMFFIQRDVSCVNFALCLPCPNLSVAYVKDRRLSGGPGTSSSPLTSYCCPVRWHFKICFNFIWLWIQSFGLLWIFFLTFAVISSVCFFTPKTLNPIFVLSIIIFPPMEKYTDLTSLPPIPLPLHLQYCSLHGLQLALSKAFWNKFATNYLSFNTTNIRVVIV